MTMYDYVWLCMTMYDYVLPRLTLFDPIWPNLAPFGPIWPCKTRFDLLFTVIPTKMMLSELLNKIPKRKKPIKLATTPKITMTKNEDL